MKNQLIKYFLAFLVVPMFVFSVGLNETVSANEGRIESIRQVGGVDWGAPNPFLQDPRGPGTTRVRLVFDSLLESDEEGLIPWLAKEWEVDGDHYTFTLREGAKFHDGKPLTTEDIAFTIDYYKKHPASNNLLGSEDDFIIEDYEIKDDQTIVIKAQKSIATTEETLGSFLILPKHIWEKVEDPMTYNDEEAFIGSGVYKLGEYNGTEGSYEFVANEDYYGYPPAADRMLYVPVGDEFLSFENGELDIANLPPDLVEAAKKNDEYLVFDKDNMWGSRLLFNFDKLEDLKELENRQAISHAIDFEAIFDKVNRKHGSVGTPNAVPPTNKYYNPDAGAYEYQPEEAKEVLEKLGLEFTILVSSGGVSEGNDAKIAELLKVDLEKAGIKVQIEELDNKVVDQRIFDEDFEVAIVSHGGWAGPPDYLRGSYSNDSLRKTRSPFSLGSVGYSNEKITELAEAQLKEIDPEKRKELLFDLQVEIAKEIPQLPLGTATRSMVYRSDSGIEMVPTASNVQVEQNRLSYVNRN